MKHGFKTHLATVGRAVIKDSRYSTARDHDSRYIDELIQEETWAVFADSAYMDRQRTERLAARGAYPGIIKRRARVPWRHRGSA
ncbi:MAG TPA: transposase [Phycisphaerae bacterium]|nr:transposase [Phycisphaerae bacterium]HNU46970.1 transposase [Phycisphaerae bacterium]